MASTVTVAPSNSSRASGRGIASTSLLLSATATWATTTRLASTNALTRWAIPLASHACSNDRRIALPSTATSRPPDEPDSAVTQLTNRRSNASGSRRANTRPNVSWLGTPPGRSRNVLNQASFEWANTSTSAHPPAPQITAHAAITIMSCSLWVTLAARGSGMSTNARRIPPVARPSMGKLLVVGRGMSGTTRGRANRARPLPRPAGGRNP
jgi:hypothetical protein